MGGRCRPDDRNGFEGAAGVALSVSITIYLCNNQITDHYFEAGACNGQYAAITDSEGR